MANLNSTNKLKIFINPAGEGKTAIADFSQYGGYSLVFDEVAQKIYLAGNTYTFKTLTNAEYTSITNAVTTLTNALNSSSSGSLANKIAALETALGTIDSNLDVSGITGDKNVKKALESLQDQIDTLQGTLNTGVVAISSGESTLTNTDAIKSAIAAVVSDGNDSASDDTVKGAKLYAASEASAAQSNAVSTVIGDTTAGHHTISSSTTDLNPNEGDNNTWLQGEEQTLSHLKDLINVITGGSSVDLAGLQTAIAAIKTELADGSETGDLANTLIDKLVTFLNNETSWTVAGTSNITNIGTIISTLETAIGAKTSSVSEGTDTNDLISITTDSSTKAVTIAPSNNLNTAYTKATSAIQSVDEGSGETLIAVDTNSSTKAVTVTSTQNLQNAVTNANNSLQLSNGETTLTNTDAIKSAIAALVSDGSDAASDDTIRGAKAYADSAASTAAGQVITWEVIGSGS